MQSSLISILMPLKNGAAYLPACLNSIVDQTYPLWELFIVDDHSTDDSYNIAAAYAQADARIKLVRNSGRGIIEALRLAFQHSSGHYITRMDSDDVMTPQKLQKMQTALQTHGKKSLALGLVKYFSEGTLGNGYANYETWLNGLTLTGTNFSEIYKECVIPSPCWMVHRDDLIACGAFDHNTYPEDYDLAFRFYKHGLNCIPSADILHYWRDYDTRTSRTDPKYAANHFLKLKLGYFLTLDRQNNRPLVLWGAGAKGKLSAQYLRKNNVPFYWICNNRKKIGKHIYKIKLHATTLLNELNQPQVIITVANKTSQKHIRTRLENQQMTTPEDYYFFC